MAAAEAPPLVEGGLESNRHAAWMTPEVRERGAASGGVESGGRRQLVLLPCRAASPSNSFHLVWPVTLLTCLAGRSVG